jgi:hypothetical protein
MLVIHEMGGGKTTTFLMFLENFPSHRWVLVCPQYLVNAYERESVERFKKPLNPKIEFVYYDNLLREVHGSTTFTGKYILVMDEVHLLSDVLHGNGDNVAKNRMLGILRQTPVKSLLLSATPIKRGMQDLQILINIASGLETLPYNKDEFNKQFTTVNRTKATIWGYGAGLITSTVGTGLISKMASAGAHKHLQSNNPYALGAAALAAIAVLSLISTKHAKMTDNHKDDMFYRDINYDALYNEINPYVSFYRLLPGSNGIPTTDARLEIIDYTREQTSLWMRFVYNKITMEDGIALGIISDSARESQLGLKTDNEETYFKWGRMIGNTNYTKYNMCFEHMRDIAFKRCVVHVGFEKSLENMVEFLRSKQKFHAFTFDVYSSKLTPQESVTMLEKFRDGLLDVLLLSPEIIEGVSIQRARQMHIMDVLESAAQMKQLRGRVVRLHSHKGLPEYEQHVTYFFYVCVLTHAIVEDNPLKNTPILQRITNFLRSQVDTAGIWMKSGAASSLNLFVPSIGQTVTPDATLWKRIRSDESIMENLLRLSTTVRRKTCPMVCCPQYTEDAEETCLAGGKVSCVDHYKLS